METLTKSNSFLNKQNIFNKKYEYRNGYVVLIIYAKYEYKS